jgi:hypothetical protein
VQWSVRTFEMVRFQSNIELCRHELSKQSGVLAGFKAGQVVVEGPSQPIV